MARDNRPPKSSPKKSPLKTKETDEDKSATRKRYYKPLIRMVGNLHQNTSMS